MHLAPVEAHQITDADAIRTPLQFAHAQRGDREGVLCGVRWVLAFVDKTRFDKVGVAPCDTVDERELSSAHLLKVGISEVELFGQPRCDLRAGEGLPVTEEP